MIPHTKTHTLFLSYDGLSDPLGGSQILPYLCGLAATGLYQIHIVSAEKPSKNLDEVHEICNKFQIQWHPVTFRNRIKGFSAWQNLRAIKKQALRVGKKYPVKIVHARSLPMGVIAQKLSQTWGASVIFDMRGFWVNERAEGEIWNMRNPVYKSLYAKMLRRETELIQKSQAVITLTHEAKKYILEHNPAISPSKISVVPCAVDMNHFSYNDYVSKRQNVLNQLGLANKWVVTYAGSLGTWYMLDEMMQFFSVLRSKNDQAVFLIITRDTSVSNVELERKYGLPSGSIIIKSASRNEMPAYMVCSHMGLFFIRPTFAKKGSSPTKLAEFLAMGIPVVSNKGIGDMDHQFAHNNIGYLVSHFSNDDYLLAVDQISEAERFKPTQIVKFAKSVYDLNKAVQTYTAVYAQLTS